MTQTPKNRVVDRLAVVLALMGQTRPIAKPKRIGVFPDGTATSAWDQHDSLINYLLLTCFDVLGQGEDFVSFQKWLDSKKLGPERQQALSSIDANLRPIEVSRALLAWYNKHYSVTKGFFRFIDSLPKAARDELLESVHIGSTKQIKSEKADKMRRDFLYQMRNSFTHGAISHITVSRMMDDSSRIMIVDATGKEPILKQAARMVEGRIDQEGAIFVSDWPFVLYRTVARAVGEPVPDFDPMYTLVVSFSADKIGQMIQVKKSDLDDKPKLSQMIEALRNVVVGSLPEVPEDWVPDMAVVRFEGE